MTDPGADGRATMREVDHAHPDHAGAATRMWRRGPARRPIADGGRRDAEGDDSRRDAGPDGGRRGTAKEDRTPDEESRTGGRGDGPEGRMRDVSHTPTEGEGANRVWDGTRVHERDDDE